MMQLRLGGLNVALAAEEALPFDPDAVVYEQDTALLLDPDAVIRDSGEDTARLVMRMLDEEEHPLGRVLVTGPYPYRMQAVVVDVEAEPMVEEGSLWTALEGVFAECAARRLTSVALPLLGTVQGDLSLERATDVFGAFFRQAEPEFLTSVVVLADTPETVMALFRRLRELARGNRWEDANSRWE